MSREFSTELLHFPTLTDLRVGQLSVLGQVCATDADLRMVAGADWLHDVGSRTGQILFSYCPEISLQDPNKNVSGVYNFSIDETKLQLDTDTLELSTASGITLPSSRRSLKVLAVLLERPGVLISHDDILRKVNNRMHTEQNGTVDNPVVIRSGIVELRRTLKYLQDKEGSDIIKNVRDAGYMIDVSDVSFTSNSAKNTIVGEEVNGSLGLIGIYGVQIMDVSDLASVAPSRNMEFSRYMEQSTEDLSVLQSYDGKIKISMETREVTVNDNRVELTYREFELLSFLMRNPNNVHPRDSILIKVWDPSYGNDGVGGYRTIDVHIRRLRAKLSDLAHRIVTVRNYGYMFNNIPQSNPENE